MSRLQQQDESTNALIGDMVKHERGVKELDQMKVHLAYLEWYMKVCKADGQGLGYYDSFKNARERRDGGHVVNEAEKKPHLSGTPVRTRWLYGGTNYRRIVEPLDITEHYKRGRKDYIKRGRSRHYILLEKWLKTTSRKRRQRAGREDSCFWARVEEAIRSCRLLNSKGSPDEDVMDLIKDYAVSLDIFLEKSSYMQWWRDHNFVGFMRNDPCKNYIGGLLSVNEEGNLNINLPGTSESSATST
ncbi:hypothetical protein EUGRSUZ_C00300 [Eucalyptus grandis]|uniref:EDS1 EP domain-containing protein n=2 Tax=Eucalyptus grandis TaxID=71139 RepID=A0A059CLS1_EUCGR|nr:hypothetical protein EUGRSUZ_C00300 [Eucalyptus grandis]